MKTVWTCVTLGLFAFGLFGCQRKGTQEPVWIGHLAAFSGPRKALGDQARQAMQLAIEDVNKEDPGPGGRRIGVLHVDVRDDNEVLQAEAVRVIQFNKTVALVGGDDPEQVGGLGRVLPNYDRPLLTPSSLPERLPAGLIFSLTVAPQFRGQCLAKFISQELKAKHTVVLLDSSGSTYGALGDAFGREFPRNDAQKLDIWSFANDSELRERGDRLKEARADAVLFAGSLSGLRKLRSQTLGLPGTLIYAGSDELLADLRRDPEACQGLILAPVYVVDKEVAVGAEFARRYQERYREPPGIAAGLAYDAVRLLVEAMRRVKQTPGSQFKSELPKVEGFSSLTGPLQIDKETGYARRTVFVIKLENGEEKVLKRYGVEKKP